MTATTAYAVPRSRATDRGGALRRVDWVLLAAVAGLLAIGALEVWSVTSGGSPSAPKGRSFLKKEAVNVGIGSVLALAAAWFDYRRLRLWAPVVYAAAVLGLVAVLSPLGATINGSHSWILLPAGFSIQPSEIAKVALVVGLAMVLSEKRGSETAAGDGDVVLALVGAAVPLGLVMLQPDLGTALVISLMVVGMIAVSGAPLRWVVLLVVTAAGLGTAAVTVPGLLSPYQVDRLTSFAHPDRDLSGSAYNVHQGMIAIGGGGLHGYGLFHGPQTQGGFVPEQQTDFIFTAVGEELGFRGALALVALLLVVLWRAGRIAWAADDLFGRLVGVGTICWFGFQAFENIGMTLGIMPVTGVPLPFVSYGGSSTFAALVAVGLLQNVHTRRSGRHPGVD
ncbi:rod shape determining protein RodA [Motilibacter rhizosphaerae]|uniref:peptidoglycan glycosyltransferase n=1 Tax=Motilibacter rhizosphaerae TaxID=598652 RepID=A0A4Q7NS08_9ACTN|nr:rod shape-determining protein RodA [Motilibacter rhizosphaerae]RZS89785.1 rod shape determining protein RodA [Motilibacter rhizosphaerae]